MQGTEDRSCTVVSSLPNTLSRAPDTRHKGINAHTQSSHLWKRKVFSDQVDQGTDGFQYQSLQRHYVKAMTGLEERVYMSRIVHTLYLGNRSLSQAVVGGAHTCGNDSWPEDRPDHIRSCLREKESEQDNGFPFPNLCDPSLTALCLVSLRHFSCLS